MAMHLALNLVNRVRFPTEGLSFTGSSVAERAAVNRHVVGSNPTR
jgi:hypothetical protein